MILLLSPLTHIFQMRKCYSINIRCSTIALLLFMLLFWISDVKQFRTFNMVRMFVCVCVCLHAILWTFIYALKFYIKCYSNSDNSNGYFISFSKNDCLTTEKGSTLQIIFDYLTHIHIYTHFQTSVMVLLSSSSTSLTSSLSLLLTLFTQNRLQKSWTTINSIETKYTIKSEI